MRVPECSARAFRRLTLVNLVLLFTVVVSGAAVRLTDSGLGCSEWPSCTPDEFVSVGSSHEAIEQLNRLFSGAIGIPIGLTLLFAYRRRPRRRDLIVLAWSMLALFLGNAVLGGIAVLVQLAWVSVMGHYLLAIALVGAALTMHRRAREEPGARVPVVTRAVSRLMVAVYALTVWVLVAGTLVTAAGPHGGDVEAERLDWPIDDAARVHSVSVDVLVVLVVVLVAMLVRTGAPRTVLATASAAVAIMTAQGVLGYVQYFEAIPPLLVGFHVAGSVLVFGTVHWLALTMRAVPAPAPVALEDRPPVTVSVATRR